MNPATERERRHPLRQAVKRGMAQVLPARLFLTRGPLGDAGVALTFDDGPHPEHTPRLLDVMKRLDLRATFFLLGRHVAAYPDIVRRIAAEGHAIGHHSYHHGEPGDVSAAELSSETRQTDALFSAITGSRRRLFRPPHGKLTLPKLLRLLQARQSIILWNVDPKDYDCRDAGEVARYFDLSPLSGGDIVLLHDTHPHAAEVLPTLVERARQRGLDFVTVERWAL